MPPSLQNICDAIWTYEERTLLAGSYLVDPSGYFEVACDAAWRQTPRTLTTVPLAVNPVTAAASPIAPTVARGAALSVDPVAAKASAVAPTVARGAALALDPVTAKASPCRADGCPGAQPWRLIRSPRTCVAPLSRGSIGVAAWRTALARRSGRREGVALVAPTLPVAQPWRLIRSPRSGRPSRRRLPWRGPFGRSGRRESVARRADGCRGGGPFARTGRRRLVAIAPTLPAQPWRSIRSPRSVRRRADGCDRRLDSADLRRSRRGSMDPGPSRCGPGRLAGPGVHCRGGRDCCAVVVAGRDPGPESGRRRVVRCCPGRGPWRDGCLGARRRGMVGDFADRNSRGRPAGCPRGVRLVNRPAYRFGRWRESVALGRSCFGSMDSGQSHCGRGGPEGLSCEQCT